MCEPSPVRLDVELYGRRAWKRAESSTKVLTAPAATFPAPATRRTHTVGWCSVQHAGLSIPETGVQIPIRLPFFRSCDAGGSPTPGLVMFASSGRSGNRPVRSLVPDVLLSPVCAGNVPIGFAEPSDSLLLNADGDLQGGSSVVHIEHAVYNREGGWFKSSPTRQVNL